MPDQFKHLKHPPSPLCIRADTTSARIVVILRTCRKLPVPLGKATRFRRIMVHRTMSRSSAALYNLRGFVILIVVAFHSFLSYLGSLPPAPAPSASPPF